MRVCFLAAMPPGIIQKIQASAVGGLYRHGTLGYQSGLHARDAARRGTCDPAVRPKGKVLSGGSGCVANVFGSGDIGVGLRRTILLNVSEVAVGIIAGGGGQAEGPQRLYAIRCGHLRCDKSSQGVIPQRRIHPCRKVICEFGRGFVTQTVSRSKKRVLTPATRPV